MPAVDKYTIENVNALVAIDEDSEYHGVDGRTVAALFRRGLIYSVGLDDNRLKLTTLGRHVINTHYVWADARFTR